MANNNKFAAVFDAVEDVKIDDDGVFKYVLINLKINNCEKNIVRGFDWAEYHADIYEKEEQSLMALGFKVKCLGGGRIKHGPTKILVYGYSIGFGRADHSIAVKLIQERYPEKIIEFSNEGY